MEISENIGNVNINFYWKHIDAESICLEDFLYILDIESNHIKSNKWIASRAEICFTRKSNKRRRKIGEEGGEKFNLSALRE